MVTVTNGDGTHTIKCTDSDGLPCDFEETVEKCTFDENYMCTICGYEHIHELSLDAETNLSSNDFRHVLVCTASYCEYTEYVDCIPDENWLCTECDKNLAYTVEPIEEAVKYAPINLNVRSIPNKSGELMKELRVNDTVTVIGKVNEFKGEVCEFYQLDDGNFADGHYLSDEEVTVSATTSSGGSKPATAPNGNALDWSQPNLVSPHSPYAEDGYVLDQVVDNGGDDICIYHPSFATDEMRNDDPGLKFFGQMQRQIEDIWCSRGHSTWSWHMDKLANGMFKWYLTE